MTQDFDSFYRQFEGLVHMRVCRLLYYYPELIEDTKQDVWLKIWRGMPTLTHDTYLSGWVWMVTNNAVRDVMRKQRIRFASSLEGYLEQKDMQGDTLLHESLWEEDPQNYIPERLARQDALLATWDKTNPKEQQTFVRYLKNEPVGRDLIVARRNFKDKYHRLLEKERMAS